MELSKKVGYIKGLMAGLKIDDSTPEGQVLAAMSDLLEEMAEEVEINSEIIDNVTAYIDDLEYCDDDCECECDDDDCDCCGDECDCCDDEEEEEDDLSDIKAVEYDEDPMPEHECGCSACAAEEPASQPAQSAPEAEVPAPATASQPAEEEEVPQYECACPICGVSFGLTQSDLDRGSVNCPGCGEILEFE
jgi:hypothetical protein